jgi:3-dehydroquinate synthase
MITKASEKAGITETGTTDKIVALCKKYGLPVSDKASYADISAVCASDKKASGGSVSLVLLDKIGSSFTKATKLSDIEKFITV